jgi:hypothetical protein
MINYEELKIGDKIVFNGVPKFYYPMFLSMRDFCDKNLVKGQIYEVADFHVNSSWVSVYLKGFEKEMLNLSFFTK